MANKNKKPTRESFRILKGGEDNNTIQVLNCTTGGATRLTHPILRLVL